MKILLKEIACARSGDKGLNSNVGIIFKSKELYLWAKKYLTVDRLRNHYKGIVLGDVARYEMDNIFALNFILYDSLGGGGSSSLLNDAQGKTHGQALLLMKVEIPKVLYKSIND